MHFRTTVIESNLTGVADFSQLFSVPFSSCIQAYPGVLFDSGDLKYHDRCFLTTDEPEKPVS